MKKDSTRHQAGFGPQNHGAQLAKLARPRYIAGPKATRHLARPAQEPVPVLALERGALALGVHGRALGVEAASSPVTHVRLELGGHK
jgi:hypothetical protein